MFSVTITPLPGATPSNLPAGDGVGATIAMDAILYHLDELSAAQAKIVNSFLGAPYVELDATGRQIGSTLPGDSATGMKEIGTSETVQMAHKNPPTPESQAYYDRHYVPILQQVIADYQRKLPIMVTGIFRCSG